MLFLSIMKPNTLIIYRPFSDISKSVACLNEKHTMKCGIINTAILLRYICIKNNWLEDDIPDWVVKNEYFKFYYNKGKPYLRDLIIYHTLAHNNWLKFEGAPTNCIIQYKNLHKLHKNHCTNIQSRLNKQYLNSHKQLLLQADNEWYTKQFKRKKKWKL